MNVYVVIVHAPHGVFIDGVYSTREEAEYNANLFDVWSPDIQVFALDGI